MSEENNRTPAARKKRVQTLKKLIILSLVLSIAIPWVCCAILFGRVHDLNRTIQEMMYRLEELNRISVEQKSDSEDIVDQNSHGTGTVSSNEALPQKESIQDRVVSKEPEGVRKVYLTFDDGPSIYTDEILDILDQYDVKATFFVVGKEDKASQKAIQEIADRGHSLGMHSYSHKYSEVYKSLDSFAEDYKKLQDYLYDITGEYSMLYRFPGGSSNTVSKIDMREFAVYLQEQGATFYDWNISSGDGGRTLLSVQSLVDNCTAELEKWDNAMILLHDSAEKKTSVEALPMIIENILALEDTVILPITEDTEPVQHIHTVQAESEEGMEE